MSDAIYLKDGEAFVAMDQQPYEAEDILQRLLAEHPALLAGGQGEGEHAWLLIQREAGIPDSVEGSNRWSMDHLSVDRNGVPTLVEVKRSSDTRGRREVVAQMLDYAANATAFWSSDHLRTRFEARFQDPDDAYAELARVLAADEPDIEAFWGRVATNLDARRLRLVFVSDAIPDELRRIIEFLNEQMTQTDVLALEVKQYVERDGARTMLVPRVIGDTSRAQDLKGRPSTPAAGKGKLAEAEVLALIDQQYPAAQAARLRSLHEFALSRGARISRGTTGLSMWFGEPSGHPISLAFWINDSWDESALSVNFVHFQDKWDRDELEVFANALEAIPGMAGHVDRARQKDFRTWLSAAPALATDETLQTLKRALAEATA